jgi:hypothetical protein
MIGIVMIGIVMIGIPVPALGINQGTYKLS